MKSWGFKDEEALLGLNEEEQEQREPLGITARGLLRLAKVRSLLGFTDVSMKVEKDLEEEDSKMSSSKTSPGAEDCLGVRSIAKGPYY